MTVIALTQEMGSLAKEVALRLAEDMKLTPMRHEVEDHLVEKMAVKPSLIRRLREGRAGMIERLRADNRGVAIYSAEEVYELAFRGDVVLRGWGATMLLRTVPHVVCVRITRSMDKRVAWLMKELGTDDEGAAAAEIRRSDDAHATRMHHQFGVRWGDPVLYDMVLNMDRLSVESAAAQIRELTQRPEFQETEASHAILRDLTLAAEVRAALRASPDTGDTNINVEANDGTVVLRGIVADNGELQATERVARGVAGVRSVANQMKPMHAPNRFITRTDD